MTLTQELDGQRIAVLMPDGFERVEVMEFREALNEAGVRTELVSPAEDGVDDRKITDHGLRSRDSRGRRPRPT